MSPFTFILSETGAPVSFDPLDADYSTNLHASQMIHRTLLEVGEGNSLKSSILKAFSYDPATFQIRFEVNENSRFSDGTPITASDIEITLKRMMAKRPTFPVLRHVRGISEWSQASSPLTSALEGVKVEGDSVIVSLARHLNSPLFRFALPLFGVVKASCVDTKTNKLHPDCATSGYYRLASSSNGLLTFELDKATSGGSTLAPDIRILHLGKPLTEQDIDISAPGTTVILKQEYSLNTEGRGKDLAGFSRTERPNDRFSVFLLNPEVGIFSSSECRRVFRDAVIDNISQISPSAQVERSLFSRILPGFMAPDELLKSSPKIEGARRRDCLARLKGKSLRWVPTPGNNFVIFEKALEKSLADLEMKSERLTAESPKESFERFVSKKIDILHGGSGFWAFDPVGDVQMLFTKGLHKPLSFVVNDDHLQGLLSDLEFEADPTQRLREINQYLYDRALMNVYTHSKRVYLVRGPGANPSVPIAITPPAPWQVFDVRQK